MLALLPTYPRSISKPSIIETLYGTLHRSQGQHIERALKRIRDRGWLRDSYVEVDRNGEDLGPGYRWQYSLTPEGFTQVKLMFLNTLPPETWDNRAGCWRDADGNALGRDVEVEETQQAVMFGA